MINAVIDISHHNKISSFDKVKQSGVIGVIQKATQGFSYADPTFTRNKTKVTTAGLLFGAYHFGVAGDPIAQADYFLSKAGNKTLLVLDFEGNPQGHDMSLEEAEHFVHYIKQITGYYPGLYSGHTIKEALAKSGVTKPEQTELSKCWLWLAQYSKGIKEPLLPKIWSKWTLWQYTDGVAGDGPYTVDGIGRCDRDQFNGTIAELKVFWTQNTA